MNSRILIGLSGPNAADVPKWKLPPIGVRFVSMFDRSLKSLTPDLGCRPVADNAYVTDLTGAKVTAADRLREIEAALIDAASDARQDQLEEA